MIIDMDKVAETLLRWREKGETSYLPDGEVDYYSEYEIAWDEFGNEVYCQYCPGEMIRFDGNSGNYICPNCNSVYSREEFFDIIDAEDLKDECLSCKEKYPSCKDGCWK